MGREGRDGWEGDVVVVGAEEDQVWRMQCTLCIVKVVEHGGRGQF